MARRSISPPPTSSPRRDTDTSTDLYMWSEETEALTLVSVGNGGATGNSDECSASWTEKCGVLAVRQQQFRVQTFLRADMFGNGLSDNAIAAGKRRHLLLLPRALDRQQGRPNRGESLRLPQRALQYVTTLEPEGFCEAKAIPAAPARSSGCRCPPMATIWRFSPPAE